MVYVAMEGYKKGDPIRLMAPFASDGTIAEDDIYRFTMRLRRFLKQAISLYAEP